MKFAKQLMSDQTAQTEKLGALVTRSMRNSWAESVEPLIRKHSPYPISYDVQSLNGMLTDLKFSEYTYTEFLGGVWVHTQCQEINCRLLQAASETSHPSLLPQQLHSVLGEELGDKYLLNGDLGEWTRARRIVFMPGHNLLNVASEEIISRLIFEHDDIYIKLHPLTLEDIVENIAKRYGWNKIIPRELSGFKLLQQCDEVYTTSASEMAFSGVLLGKSVYNVSNFIWEGYGGYLPLFRLMFKHSDLIKNQAIIHNLIQCPWSGLIFPHQQDVEERVMQYYQKTLELRNFFKPLSPPFRPRTGVSTVNPS